MKKHIKNLKIVRNYRTEQSSVANVVNVMQDGKEVNESRGEVKIDAYNHKTLLNYKLKLLTK